jgi:hypothetical protein
MDKVLLTILSMPRGPNDVRTASLIATPEFSGYIFSKFGETYLLQQPD